MDPIDTRLKLSALWMFVLLNMIFRDIHQFALKSHLEMLLTGTYNGIEITEGLMLLGGFLIEVPIAMVVLPLFLSRKISRPATLLAALITATTLLSSLPGDMDDLFFLLIELAAILVIIWSAWTWPKVGRRNG
ncbi:DUF6326 family protein [Hyphomonas sp.]|uniref:DUF6326 family protein n=1 Tax=Hyphomonas sp. TaxID=87 RepID=UPI0032EDA52A